MTTLDTDKPLHVDPDCQALVSTGSLARPYIAARGEHDFVTEAAVQRWKAALPRVTPLVARGGSHLPFLEAHAAAPYLRAVAGFVASCEEEQEAEQRRGEEQIEKKILDVLLYVV